MRTIYRIYETGEELEGVEAASTIRFVYTALQVKNLDKSVKFYTETLAMRIIARKPVKETNGEMCVLGSGKNRLELNWYGDENVQWGNTLDHLAFEVEPFPAFRRLIKELKAKGVRLHEYLETENWDRFFVEDPDKNWIEVYSRKG